MKRLSVNQRKKSFRRIIKLKGKIPKILSVGLALVLALSLSLVTAVPAMAGNPTIELTTPGGGIDGLTGTPTGSGTEAGVHSIVVTAATASTLTGTDAESDTAEDKIAASLDGTETLILTIGGTEITTAALAPATADTTLLADVAADIQAKINAATTAPDVDVAVTVAGTTPGQYFVITVALAGVNNSITTQVTGTNGGETETCLGGEAPVAGTDADAVDILTPATAGSNGLWQADPSYGNESTTMTITHTTTAGTASTLAGLKALVTAADAFIEGITLIAYGALSAGNPEVTVSAGTAGYLVVTGTATMDADTENELTVTAYDDAGNLAATYTGDKDLTFSGPSVAIDGTVPTVEGTDIGEEQTVAFTAGVAGGGSLTLIACVAEATTVDVSDGTIDSSADPTYDLDLFVEGTNFDKLFYGIPDDVAVTVCDEGANADPIRTDTVEVAATSSVTGDVITVTLTETGGVDSGIFTGTFPLVATVPEPGPGELAAADGDLITVDAADVPDPLTTATVDMSAPVFAADTTADVPFYNNEDTITLTVTLDAAGYTVTADFSNIDSEYTIGDEEFADLGAGDYTVTYTISADNATDDGLCAIPVTAEDEAGNTAIDTSCSVTLDNTAPEVTLATADPVVIQPDPAAPDVTFTATVSDGDGSGVDTVTIDLSSLLLSATQAMLDDGASGDGEADDGVYGYICEALSAAADTYDLTVTATDALGNENATVDITLNVIADLDDPDIVSTLVEYPVGLESARPNETVVITIVVTDVLSGVNTVTIDAEDIGLSDSETLTAEADDTWTAELTVGEVDADTYTLTITVTDFAENAATADVDVVVTFVLTGYNIDLLEGWNLISLPLIPDDSDIETVLGDVTVESVWFYEPTYLTDGIDNNEDGTIDEAVEAWLSYSPGDPSDLSEMRDGLGYWVSMAAPATLSVSGITMPEPPTVPPTYPVVAGWNLIGFKSTGPNTVVLYLTNTFPTVVWQYQNAMYSTPVDMYPGQGYWVWFNIAGTIVPQDAPLP